MSYDHNDDELLDGELDQDALTITIMGETLDIDYMISADYELVNHPLETRFIIATDSLGAVFEIDADEGIVEAIIYH